MQKCFPRCSKGACKTKIEKHSLRFGSCATAAWDGETTHFRKLTCMTKKVAQNALDFYDGDITGLRGWDALSPDDQTEVRDLFDSLINSEEPAKPKAAKKKAEKKKKDADVADEEEEAEPPAKKSKKAKKAPKADAVKLVVD